MLALREFAAADDAALISWIASEGELERFAGPTLRWPLTSGQLQALRDAPEIESWTAYIPPSVEVAVGHIEIVLTGRTAGLLARVLVDPARRGEGLGRDLVAAALDRARRRGLRTLDLNVLEDNEPAIRTYVGLGFSDADRDPASPRLRLLTKVI